MNIVKFLDTIKEGDTLFNEKYKGKYCYYINCLYCIPFDDMSTSAYVTVSKGQSSWETIKTGYPNAIKIADYETLVDGTATQNANSIVKFIEANRFTTDSDITIDELRRFRTWVAEKLANFKADETNEIKWMVNYYVKEMTDDTVEHLQQFSNVAVTTTTTTKSKCNCGCGTSASTGILSVCDTVDIYKKGVRETMIKWFSTIDFWMDDNMQSFLLMMKKYVENIIAVGFRLTKSTEDKTIYTCACLNDDDAMQKQMVRILENLITSLTYMTTNNVDRNRNFITESLGAWSSQLYETMRW